jgi:hypothetical protein
VGRVVWAAEQASMRNFSHRAVRAQWAMGHRRTWTEFYFFIVFQISKSSNLANFVQILTIFAQVFPIQSNPMKSLF